MYVLGRKANSRSVNWNYFGLKLDGDGKPINEDRPVCRKCKMSVSAKCSNTSNILHHLRDHHSLLYKEASTHQELGRKSTESTNETDSGTQLTIAETIDQSMKYPSQSPQAQELNQPVSVFIVKGMHLILTVEEPSFVSMLNK